MFGGWFSWRPPHIASRIDRTWNYHGGNFLLTHYSQHARRVVATKVKRTNAALQAPTVLLSARELTSIRACEAIPKTIVHVAITIKVV